KIGLFIAEGTKCLEDTFVHFDVEALIMLDGSAFDAGRYSITPHIADSSDMRRISQFQTLPDVIGVYRIPEPQPIDEAMLSTSLTLLLDGIQDPGNLGTILRIASWFGIGQVVLGKGCADPYNPKAVQSSMGAVGMVRTVQADLIELAEAHPDIPLCGTLLEGSDIYTTPLPSPAMIAMGNEGNGLSEQLRRRVTLPLHIPSFANTPHAESLNVAAATAVTVSEFRRRQYYPIPN
ncbi:MAG: RNA methyltransferase, partial [Muribaculaceae bacterium]|nr:RNA methyltransferase [Muribaculaceae bacterium]